MLLPDRKGVELCKVIELYTAKEQNNSRNYLVTYTECCVHVP